MFEILNNLFTQIAYQPFFNLLVLIYYGLEKVILRADMGMAVVFFTIVFRIIILPLSLSTNQTTAEKEEMMDKLKLIETQYKNDPVKRKMESKKIFRSNKRVIFAEFFDVSLQVLIALMLYRIFSTGLEGADFHLLYPGINQPSQPFNLIFLGVYDLSKPNFLLNLINSVVIFIAEAVNIANQQRLITREDKMALFVFPIIAFFFFAYMPAGKKLFVITTLLFSIAIMVVQILSFWYHRLSNKLSSVFYSKVKKEK